MPEADQERIERRETLAFEAGQRQALVDGRLDAHDRRFALINGSIEKHARHAADTTKSIEGLRDEIAAISGALATRAALEAERVAQVKRANEKQISRRDFVLGVVGLAVIILGALLGPVLAHALSA